jgi:hypothetical protein
MVKLKSWQRLLLALLVGMLAMGLRLDAASRLTIDDDEDTYMNVALHYAWSIRYGGWQEVYRHTQNAEHPILAKLVYAAVLSGVSPAEKLQPKDIERLPVQQTPGALWILAARRTAAVLGGLVVLALALVNPLAGLFLALHTTAIKFTSEVVLDPLPFLTSLLVIMTYDRWSKNEFRSETAGRWNGLWLLASVVLMGMTAAGKYIYCIVGLAICVDFLIRLWKDFRAGKRGQALRQLSLMLAWGLGSVLFFFIFDPILWKHPEQRFFDSVLYHINYSMSGYVQASGRAWWYPLKLLILSAPQQDPIDAGIFYMEPDLWIALLALAGLPLLWVRHRIYALWLMTALAFLLSWPTKWDQYELITLPAVCLSAGVLCIELLKRGLAKVKMIT